MYDEQLLYVPSDCKFVIAWLEGLGPLQLLEASCAFGLVRKQSQWQSPDAQCWRCCWCWCSESGFSGKVFSLLWVSLVVFINSSSSRSVRLRCG